MTLFGGRSGYGWRRLVSSQNDLPHLRLDFSWTLEARADHYSFFERDIPVLMFHTGLHDDYHRPSDVADRINKAGMERITRLLFGVVYELAERPAVPGFRAAARHESPDTEQALLSEAGKPADRLGVGWTEDAATAGGVRLSSVDAGSAAARAGLREGDLIVRFAGRAIQSDDDFFAAVAAAESPASLSVRRPGQEKPLKLSVQLAGPPLRWGLAWRVDDAEPGAVILTHVVRGSPAARAGLAPGDRIYQLAGREFADEAAFALLAKTAADPLQLLIEGDGRLRIVMLRLQQAEPVKRRREWWDSDESVCAAIDSECFRSIPSERVDFDNPTFLVGQNGSGKSNFVRAFSFSWRTRWRRPCKRCLTSRGALLRFAIAVPCKATHPMSAWELSLARSMARLPALATRLRSARCLTMASRWCVSSV